MNKIFLIGNLTRDPESGTSAAGISYCRFSIAVNRRFSKEQAEVDYFNVVTWRGLADVCAKSLGKGKKVAITGQLQIRNYDGNDGTKRTSVDVIADEVEFISPKGGSDGEANYTPSQSKRADDITQLTPVKEDELPF